jgi:hypothetical protein
MTENSAIFNARHGAGPFYPHRQPEPTAQDCLKRGEGANWRTIRQLSGECRLKAGRKTNMRKLAFAALGSFLLASPTLADTIYATSFESSTFTAGFPLVGQDGWAEPLSFLNPNAAIITTDQPFEGKQAVRVRGADLVPDSDNIGFLTSG